MYELGLCLVSGDSGEGFEPTLLLANEPFELLLALGHCLFLATELARASADILLALLEHIEFPVERRLAILDPLLLSLDFLATPACFDFPVLAEPDELFLAGDERAL